MWLQVATILVDSNPMKPRSVRLGVPDLRTTVAVAQHARGFGLAARVDFDCPGADRYVLSVGECSRLGDVVALSRRADKSVEQAFCGVVGCVVAGGVSGLQPEAVVGYRLGGGIAAYAQTVEEFFCSQMGVGVVGQVVDLGCERVDGCGCEALGSVDHP